MSPRSMVGVVAVVAILAAAALWLWWSPVSQVQPDSSTVGDKQVPAIVDRASRSYAAGRKLEARHRPGEDAELKGNITIDPTRRLWGIDNPLVQEQFEESARSHLQFEKLLTLELAAELRVILLLAQRDALELTANAEYLPEGFNIIQHGPPAAANEQIRELLSDEQWSVYKTTDAYTGTYLFFPIFSAGDEDQRLFQAPKWMEGVAENR